MAFSVFSSVALDFDKVEVEWIIVSYSANLVSSFVDSSSCFLVKDSVRSVMFLFKVSRFRAMDALS